MTKSQWIDISLPIYAGMKKASPREPKVEIKLHRDPAKGDPVTMGQISMIYHSGTHIDAPRHVFVNETAIDSLPLDIFTGPARVIEIKDNESIKIPELVAYDIHSGERILFKTKNSSWVYDTNFETDKILMGCVYITREATNFLVEKEVRLIGLDSFTIGAPNPEENMEVHKAFLKAGIPILEQINLTGVKAGWYELIAFPLRLRDGDAGPCRAAIKPL